jgi:polyhydroxyalkanoate synthesis regulator phasin
MMGKMMEQMMPNCLTMMLPGLPKEKREDFVLEMVATLVEQGSSGMSKEEAEEFVAKVVERAKASLGNEKAEVS